MSTAGRPSDSAANDLSSALREVGFVRLAAAADADSVAAAGILANVLSGRGVPYQTSVTPPGEPAERATDADLTVGIGRQAGDLTIGVDDSAARTAHAVADEHGSSDLALALAGAVAADGHPGDALATAAGDAGIERRPGIAVPTPDLVDGLAYSTLVHAPFSGDREAVEALFAEAGLEAEPTADGAGRTVASQVALSVAGDPDGTASGADHVERLLRPLAGGPFGTMGGYADVLTAVARERPGLAVVLALGELDADRALEIWREHGRRAHRGLREARTGRYDGLFVLRCEPDRPLRTVAELAAAYRSPEPVVLAVADGTAVAAGARADLGEAMRETASEFGATGGGTSGLGRASFDAEATEFVAAFKEQL